MTDELERYIRANRDAYTEEALRRRLRDDGHSEAAIEAAWLAVASEDVRLKVQARQPAPSTARSLATGAAIVMVFLAYMTAIVYGLVGVCVTIVFRNASPSGTWFVFLVVCLVGGLLVSMYQLTRGHDTWAALGAAFALAVLIFGVLFLLLVAGGSR